MTKPPSENYKKCYIGTTVLIFGRHTIGLYKAVRGKDV